MPRCQYLKDDGTQCKNKASTGSIYCRPHKARTLGGFAVPAQDIHEQYPGSAPAWIVWFLGAVLLFVAAYAAVTALAAACRELRESPASTVLWLRVAFLSGTVTGIAMAYVGCHCFMFTQASIGAVAKRPLTALAVRLFYWGVLILSASFVAERLVSLLSLSAGPTPLDVVGIVALGLSACGALLVILALRNPMVYFARWPSWLFDLLADGVTATMIAYYRLRAEPDMLTLLTVAMLLVFMAQRSLARLRGLNQSDTSLNEMLRAVYSNQEMLSLAVPLSQRRLARAIVLAKYEGLTDLEKSELRQHIGGRLGRRFTQILAVARGILVIVAIQLFLKEPSSRLYVLMCTYLAERGIDLDWLCR